MLAAITPSPNSFTAQLAIAAGTVANLLAAVKVAGGRKCVPYEFIITLKFKS